MTDLMQKFLSYPSELGLQKSMDMMQNYGRALLQQIRCVETYRLGCLHTWIFF